jgi:hypothetical protein
MEDRVVDFFLGLIWILIGAAALLAGYRFFRVLLPIFGFLAGFVAGAQAIALIFNEGFLASILGILAGIALGLLLAFISYIWWWLGVIIAIGAMGYAIGYGLLPLIGIDLDFVNVLIGLAFGIAVAAVAAIFQLPRLLVIFWTSVWGAATAIVGFLMVIGRVSSEDLGYGGIDQYVNHEWFWLIAWVVLAAVGVLIQLTTSDEYDIVPPSSGTFTGGSSVPPPQDHRVSGP